MSDPVSNDAQVYSLADQRAARNSRTAPDGVAGRARCAATTASGSPCRNYAVDGALCRVHARGAAEGTTPASNQPPRRQPGLAGPGPARRRSGGDTEVAGAGNGGRAGAVDHDDEVAGTQGVGGARAGGMAGEESGAAGEESGAAGEDAGAGGGASARGRGRGAGGGAPARGRGRGAGGGASARGRGRGAGGGASGGGARRGTGDDPGSGPSYGSFRWAEAQLLERGYGAAVDGLELLRDAADERFIDALRGLVAFLRRRVTGAYEIDEFGFDEDLTTNVLMPLLRPLHRSYWRVTSHGIEHVPDEGGALLVANHAGTLPADALITRLDVFDLTGRHARELGADLVFRTPFVGEFARKTGATLASGDDADRLLSAGELVAVWPEGFKGLGKPWRDRYKLQRFGRGGFVATASRSGVPIIPTAIVGSEEIYPMLFDLRVVARLLGFPYFPVVPQMFALPVLGPFALLPLPSKWIIEYGEPIDTGVLSAGLAEDPMALFDLTDQVRQRIQDMLHRNLMGRRSVFL